MDALAPESGSHALIVYPLKNNTHYFEWAPLENNADDSEWIQPDDDSPHTYPGPHEEPPLHTDEELEEIFRDLDFQ